MIYVDASTTDEVLACAVGYLTGTPPQTQFVPLSSGYQLQYTPRGQTPSATTGWVNPVTDGTVTGIEISNLRPGQIYTVWAQITTTGGKKPIIRLDDFQVQS